VHWQHGLAGNHENHGLNRDATEDVADRDVELAAGGREQDQPAEGLAQVQAVGQDVGVVGQEDPGDPDRDRAADEDENLGLDVLTRSVVDAVDG
jgi:hypothetical protein